MLLLHTQNECGCNSAPCAVVRGSNNLSLWNDPELFLLSPSV